MAGSVFGARVRRGRQILASALAAGGRGRCGIGEERSQSPASCSASHLRSHRYTVSRAPLAATVHPRRSTGWPAAACRTPPAALSLQPSARGPLHTLESTLRHRGQRASRCQQGRREPRVDRSSPSVHRGPGARRSGRDLGGVGIPLLSWRRWHGSRAHCKASRETAGWASRQTRQRGVSGPATLVAAPERH